MHGVPEDFMLEAESGYRIYYYSFMQPCYGKFYFDDDTEYKVEVIDTWNMTITNAGIYKRAFQKLFFQVRNIWQLGFKKRIGKNCKQEYC